MAYYCKVGGTAYNDLLVRFLLLFNLVFASSVLLDLLGGEPLVGDWVRVPYLLSYSYGFVKRGLVGTALSLLRLNPNEGTVLVLYVLAFEIFTILFYLFARREGRNNPLIPYLLTLFLLSPTTVFHMGDDLGRTDIYLYLLLLLSLNFPGLSPLLTVLAVLIHEGYVLLALPVLILSLYLKGRRRLAASIGVVGGVGAGIVSLLGRLSRKEAETYSSIFASHGITTTDPILPLYLSPIRNSLHFYAKFLSDPSARVSVAMGMLAVLLLVTIHFLLLYRLSRGPSYLKVVPLSPLLMFLFGVDYFRWASATSIGMALAFLLLGRRFGVREPGRVDKALFLLSLLSLPVEVVKELIT